MNIVAAPQIGASELRRQVKLGRAAATINKAKQPDTNICGVRWFAILWL
jgi:hypothetical protein